MLARAERCAEILQGTSQRVVMSYPSAAALIAQVHHEALQRLSREAGCRLQGLSQGARLLSLRAPWPRRLRDLDAAAAYVRHSTAERNIDFIRALELELRGRAERFYIGDVGVDDAIATDSEVGFPLHAHASVGLPGEGTGEHYTPLPHDEGETLLTEGCDQARYGVHREGPHGPVGPKPDPEAPQTPISRGPRAVARDSTSGDPQEAAYVARESDRSEVFLARCLSGSCLSSATSGPAARPAAAAPAPWRAGRPKMMSTSIPPSPTASSRARPPTPPPAPAPRQELLVDALIPEALNPGPGTCSSASSMFQQGRVVLHFHLSRGWPLCSSLASAKALGPWLCQFELVANRRAPPTACAGAAVKF